MDSRGLWHVFDRRRPPGRYRAGEVDMRPLAALRGEFCEVGCFVCGLPRGLWSASGGEGWMMSGHTFCCRGCAEGGLCECRR